MKQLINYHLKPLDLPVLIIASITSRIHAVMFGKIEQILPQQVNNFRLIGEIEKTTLRKPFKIGIYQSTDGRKAIGKYWEGKVKDFNYYSLQNEILMYQMLNKAVKRLGARMPQKFSNMYIPQYYGHKQTPNGLVLFLEFVDGKILEGYSQEKIVSVYEKAFTYIQYLGTQLTQKERASISQRSAKQYIVLYPFLVAKALLSHPKAGGTIIKGIPLFIRSIPTLLQNNELSLVHRDLHFNNILVGKKITLIDLQLCTYTEAMYELITTLRNRWSNKSLRQLLSAQIRHKFPLEKNTNKKYQALCINAGTHALTGTNFNKKEIKQFIDFLAYATTLTI